jgi:hypothetical protein
MNPRSDPARSLFQRGVLTLFALCAGCQDSAGRMSSSVWVATQENAPGFRAVESIEVVLPGQAESEALLANLLRTRLAFEFCFQQMPAETKLAVSVAVRTEGEFLVAAAQAPESPVAACVAKAIDGRWLPKGVRSGDAGTVRVRFKGCMGEDCVPMARRPRQCGYSDGFDREDFNRCQYGGDF